MNIHLLNHDIIESLHERGFTEDSIKNLTSDQIFDEYCEWNGLTNWGPALREVMSNIKSAK